MSQSATAALGAVSPQTANQERAEFEQRLAGHLLAAGKLGGENLERAQRLREEQDSREPLGLLLVKLGLLSDRDLAEATADLLGLPLIELKELPDPPSLEQRVSSSFLKQNKALLLSEEDDQVILVMADPLDSFVIGAVRMIAGKPVALRVGIGGEIEQALERRNTEASTQNQAPGGDLDVRYQDDVEHLKELASEAPVIKLVNKIMHGAAAAGASDVHIEPFENRLMVRYRVDGLLRAADSPPTQSASAVISRIKIMSNLNIAERRLPQDGRFKMRVGGQSIDLRVSTVPTMWGESLVLRLLNRDDNALDFGPLGFSRDMEQALLQVLDMPHGILLVTGPTGSGKTTTLYAALSHLNTLERKILTVEDPVEYNIDGINQIQVKPQIGLTFANALRSIVRQDPDIIMVGEMRDTETAKIAVQSALTGHLVLSTLHTNDAAGSITRLLDMGVEDYLLASTVNAVQAQRLVRTLCPACRTPYRPAESQVRRWRLDRFADDGELTLYRAVGCDQCDGTGYRGRNAIVELLVMNDRLGSLIQENPEARRIAELAASQGMRSMFEDGLRKAMEGTTSIEEVLRVTQET